MNCFSHDFNTHFYSISIFLIAQISKTIKYIFLKKLRNRRILNMILNKNEVS